jgi:hypothetical protein
MREASDIVLDGYARARPSALGGYQTAIASASQGQSYNIQIESNVGSVCSLACDG